MTGAHVHCCLLQVSGLGAGQLAAGVERVPGLTWRSVASVADVLGVLAEGNRGRATAATALNAHSSRCAWGHSPSVWEPQAPAYGNKRRQATCALRAVSCGTVCIAMHRWRAGRHHLACSSVGTMAPPSWRAASACGRPSP